MSPKNSESRHRAAASRGCRLTRSHFPQEQQQQVQVQVQEQQLEEAVASSSWAGAQRFVVVAVDNH